MRAAYARLTALTLLMLEQRMSRGFLLHLRKVSKCVREFTQAEWSNHQLRLKLDMLRSKTWRSRVLKDLGGEAALARWDRRMARSSKPKTEPSTAEAPIWRKTPERITEEMRQKAHAIKCAKATAHPILRAILSGWILRGNFAFRLCQEARARDGQRKRCSRRPQIIWSDMNIMPCPSLR